MKWLQTAHIIGYRRTCQEDATAAGIDAEWQPDNREAGATLYQVAVRHQQERCTVFLLDLLALLRDAAARALAEVLRCKSLVKVLFFFFTRS